jgi:hypothetical protein
MDSRKMLDVCCKGNKLGNRNQFWILALNFVIGWLESVSPVTRTSSTQNIVTTEKAHCSVRGMKTVWKPVIWTSAEPQIIWGSRGRWLYCEKLPKVRKKTQRNCDKITINSAFPSSPALLIYLYVKRPNSSSTLKEKTSNLQPFTVCLTMTWQVWTMMIVSINFTTYRWKYRTGCQNSTFETTSTWKAFRVVFFTKRVREPTVDKKSVRIGFFTNIVVQELFSWKRPRNSLIYLG